MLSKVLYLSKKKLGSGKIFLTLKFFAVFFSLCKKVEKCVKVLEFGLWGLNVSLLFFNPCAIESTPTLYIHSFTYHNVKGYALSWLIWLLKISNFAKNPTFSPNLSRFSASNILEILAKVPICNLFTLIKVSSCFRLWIRVQKSDQVYSSFQVKVIKWRI